MPKTILGVREKVRNESMYGKIRVAENETASSIGVGSNSKEPEYQLQLELKLGVTAKGSSPVDIVLYRKTDHSLSQVQ